MQVPDSSEGRAGMPMDLAVRAQHLNLYDQAHFLAAVVNFRVRPGRCRVCYVRPGRLGRMNPEAASNGGHYTIRTHEQVYPRHRVEAPEATRDSPRRPAWAHNRKDWRSTFAPPARFNSKKLTVWPRNNPRRKRSMGGRSSSTNVCQTFSRSTSGWVRTIGRNRRVRSRCCRSTAASWRFRFIGTIRSFHPISAKSQE